MPVLCGRKTFEALEKLYGVEKYGPTKQADWKARRRVVTVANIEDAIF